MNAKLKALVFIALGVSLFVVGINMKYAVNQWNETTVTQREISGTKVRNAALGAGAGLVGGGVLAALVGGVGVVVAGTGVGLPAGAALIALAASVGASAGAVTGAALGDSSTTAKEEVTVTRSVPAYATWQWATVLAVGTVLLLLAVLEIRKL